LEGKAGKEGGRRERRRVRNCEQHPCAIDWKEGEKGGRKEGEEKEDEKS